MQDKTNESEIIVSVVVCTYNRSNLLRTCLKSLVNQTADASLYEILIIDNNSTDNTQEIISEFVDINNNFSAFIELNQGLSYARNRGYREAKGNYVAYIDDDAKADEKWIEVIIDTINNINPKPLIIGGQIFPYYDFEKPKWFKDRYEIRSCGKKPKFLKKNESFSGSNMVLKKEVLYKYNGFPTNLGIKKDNLILGEETYLFNLVEKNELNPKLFYYNFKLIVEHIVFPYKTKISYPFKRYLSSGQTLHFILRGNIVKVFYVFIFHFLAIFYMSIRAIFYLFFFPNYKNWIFERIAPIFYSIGYLTSAIGINIKIKIK